MSLRDRLEIFWFDFAWPWIKGWIRHGWQNPGYTAGWVIVGMIAVAVGKLVRVVLA